MPHHALTGKNIAIIGSGIAGLSTAYYLDTLTGANVHVYEANDYAGGHVNTVSVPTESGELHIDTGFIVCNERTYPNFLRLLAELGVAYQNSEMSFSVRHDKTGLEYNGHNINTLFAQRRNLLNPGFWRLVRDILHFNTDVRQTVAKAAGTQAAYQTIGEYLDSKRYGKLFVHNYLLPMIAAIWSMGLAQARAFPLAFFVKFFDNHGLLDIKNRPQWYTIVGGSKQYVAKLLAAFSGSMSLSTPVTRVIRHAQGVTVTAKTAQGGKVAAEYDEVVFACHADTALALLADVSAEEARVLSQFHYSKNRATLHTDTSVLPKNQRCWASWNYRCDSNDVTSLPKLTYHMNILQRLPQALDTHYLVSLNQDIASAHTIKTIDYTHPIFTPEMVAAQGEWQRISGQQHTHFCGAYWFNGFHEDGIKSGLRVCQALGVDIDVLDYDTQTAQNQHVYSKNNTT